MAPRAALCLAALLALGAAGAAAYRPLDAMNMWLNDAPFAAQVSAAWRGAAPAAGAAGKPAVSSHRGADDKAYIAVRYFVDPEHHDDFIKEWRDLEDKVKDEKGNCIFDLKKTMDDDLVFLGYGEWETLEDLEDHATSDHVEHFLDAVRDMDIPWALQPLYNPKDAGELTKGGAQCGRRAEPDDANRRRKRGHMAHVIVRYVAPPSAHGDLVGAWRKAMEDTSKEEGARIYSLRKVLNDNIQWWGYGAWDSMEDFHEHMKSDHVRKLHDRLGELHVYWHLTPLYKIGDQPE